MKYLSFDIEATGLEEDALIIEFGMIPFDTKTKTLEEDLKEHLYVQCPPFETLKDKLNQWVIDNNKELIQKANKDGKTIPEFKEILVKYLTSKKVRDYFGNDKIVLFGKSVNAIDLPFLNRDLGWDFMTEYFHHRTFDLSAYTYGLIDMNLLPQKMDSGTELMKFLGMGEVAHTALEDAKNTAIMYLKLLEKFSIS